jgi:hypothetical protein
MVFGLNLKVLYGFDSCMHGSKPFIRKEILKKYQCEKAVS